MTGNTKTLHEALTIEERHVVQEWFVRRHDQLRFPTGCRRKTDRTIDVLTLDQWRQRFNMSQTDLIRRLRDLRVKKSGAGVSLETIRKFEDGTIASREADLFLPRIAEVFGIESAQIRIPKGARLVDTDRLVNNRDVRNWRRRAA